MNEIRAIDTEYKGYLFRSRLEARWAVFFDELGVRWEYEPEGILLSDGTSYLPDFYLIDFRCYFEVKRKGIKGSPEGDEAVRKISDGMKEGTWAGIIAFGDPKDDDLTIFCQEADDWGAGSYEAKVTIPIYRGFSPTTIPGRDSSIRALVKTHRWFPWIQHRLVRSTPTT